MTPICENHFYYCTASPVKMKFRKICKGSS